MPEPKQIPPSSDAKSATKPPPEQKAPSKEPTKPKPPAQQKDDALKYEMKFANGGFNNGVEIKPARDGKVELKVSIYGGGEQNVMRISPVPESIAKMIKAYEIGAEKTGEPDSGITEELQSYFDDIRTNLSVEIIQILTDVDSKIESAIKKAFSQANSRY